MIQQNKSQNSEEHCCQGGSADSRISHNRNLARKTPIELTNPSHRLKTTARRALFEIPQTAHPLVCSLTEHSLQAQSNSNLDHTPSPPPHSRVSVFVWAHHISPIRLPHSLFCPALGAFEGDFLTTELEPVPGVCPFPLPL